MNRLIPFLVLLSVSLVCATPNTAKHKAHDARQQAVVLSGLPQKVNPKARYLFYLSGYIVQAGNTRPTSPKFGVYEYQQILDTLKQSGFVVISEARKQSPEIGPYAAKVAGQVKQLLEAGVPPQNITVVGASQGSFIAMLVSTYLENRKVNFVVIGGCTAEDGFLQLVNLHGNVLFISERTDLAGSCERFRADATGLEKYKFVETNTGQRHGFLYRPMKEWVEPTVAWAQGHFEADEGQSLEQALMHLQRIFDEAEARKDLAALDRLLADDYVFTSPTGLVSDKKQLIEDIKKAEPGTEETINYEEVKVHPYGNAAIVSYVLIVKGQDKAGKDYTNRYRNTVTWVSDQKHWRMASIHVSRMRA